MNYLNFLKLFLIMGLMALVSCNSSHKKNSHVVARDSIIVKDDYSDIRVHYPNTNFALFNDSIQQMVNVLVQEFETLSKSIPDTFYRPYQMMVDYDYQKSYKRYLSVSFSVYQFTGGAHGNTFFKTYLFDQKQNKLLYLKDILPKGTFGELRSLVRTKLNAKLNFSDFINDGTESLHDFNRFQVTDSSVVFLFQPYDVAPYSEGSHEVEVLMREFPFLLDN